ncbi:eukaryotic translation initiation factor 2-alpha kinase 3 [Nothobranchius furzeri]|uniref:Eukaryotic translation initiation factor 2-alpha kinase 3-like n=1 Tax=Nothobranchius furzeri TaxID=105023 RepID=A0A9D2YFS6_NOTFU|nr:eukaryotic translation initiation factor 2-alpha kinase 3-like [Nothobranchius furzeri]
MMVDIIGENHVERSAGVGTTPYMAPEQYGTNYNHKVDLFPVGLIWFECLWRVSTGHERVVIWPDLRKKKFPRGFENTCFDQCIKIKRLLCKNPQERPEASELLSTLSPKENSYKTSSCTKPPSASLP